VINNPQTLAKLRAWVRLSQLPDPAPTLALVKGPVQSAGEAGKAEGLDRVSQTNQTWVGVLREVAIRKSNENGEVFIDDLRRWANSEGLSASDFCDRCSNGTDCDRVHKNAWGAVFRGKDWAFTGEYRKSKYASNHARHCKVWKYVGTENR
jgi:hypothetical protein